MWCNVFYNFGTLYGSKSVLNGGLLSMTRSCFDSTKMNSTNTIYWKQALDMNWYDWLVWAFNFRLSLFCLCLIWWIKSIVFLTTYLMRHMYSLVISNFFMKYVWLGLYKWRNYLDIKRRCWYTTRGKSNHLITFVFLNARCTIYTFGTRELYLVGRSLSFIYRVLVQSMFNTFVSSNRIYLRLFSLLLSKDNIVETSSIMNINLFD